MPGNTHIDENLASVVRYALETTRATTVCPFHPNVTIRVGDDAAETHAYIRAHRIVKSDGTTWEREEQMACNFSHAQIVPFEDAGYPASFLLLPCSADGLGISQAT